MNNKLNNYLIINYTKVLFNAILLSFCLGLILNLFEEVEFFKNTEESLLLPVILTLSYIPNLIFVNLMPFIYARFKKKITKEQFEKMLKTFIPNITAKTIHRVTLLSLIGPLYAFYLIAKFIGKSTIASLDDDTEDQKETEKEVNKMTRRDFLLIFKPQIN